MSDSLQPHEPQHARPPCPSPTPTVHPDPCPLSQWCHPTNSSSVGPFISCPQSFPASGSFPMSQLFASGGQSIGVLASTSVLPMNTQDWSPLGWTGWISLQSKISLPCTMHVRCLTQNQHPGGDQSVWLLYPKPPGDVWHFSSVTLWHRSPEKSTLFALLWNENKLRNHLFLIVRPYAKTVYRNVTIPVCLGRRNCAHTNHVCTDLT